MTTASLYRRAAAAALAAAALLGAAPVAGAAVPVSFQRIAGFDEPATPARYDKVGVLRIGRASAPNILVLNPGTSASAAYFAPLAKSIVRRAPSWQVWAVERRENLLEDHSMLDRAKRREVTTRQLQDYYLGWLENTAITDHIRLIPDSEVAFAREWGMRVEIEDLRRVVALAERRRPRRIVMGGHSLGGSIATAYATWDFGGRAGGRDLAGLVLIDGGSNPQPVTAEQATQSLQELQTRTPWLSFGGLPTPFAGLFNGVGAIAVKLDPNGRSIAADSTLLPADLKPPVTATNLAQYGFALDVSTSPPALAAAQAHLGRLAASGDPRGWDRAGALTPVVRYAEMFGGWGLKGLDGTAWYHPQRLTLDSQAVAAGNANAAQEVLDVRATHGDDLPRDLRIYAFGALGGARIVTAARALATQSRIPRRNLTLLDRQGTYAHNDPAGASPRNEFLSNLITFLRRVARG